MGNQFVSLPTPAGNGSGAAVDVSTFGGVKTITSSGNGFTLEPTVTIEFSNELVPTRFAPLWTFGKPGEKTVIVAARWMRATVANFRGGVAPVVDVGGNDLNASFATLVAPAGGGNGAAVDVTALANFKTIHVAGPFRGALNIDISEDGGTTFSQVATFKAPGYKSLELVAEFMRVTRNGVPQNSPGLPVVNIGATVGGGGDAGIEVAEEGVDLPGGPFDTVNFVGAGVTATDGGGGVAVVTIPGAAASTKQVFRYVATGLEANPFTIGGAQGFAARANANYNVQITMGGPLANAIKIPRALVASFAINQFDVEFSSPLDLGDVWQFTVEDLS